jgi:glycosyltransferase involved in cell wall biosynthesis
MFYKALGKKIVFTAHNINERERDGGRNLLHTYSLRLLYALVDHIFVHTAKMKTQLVQEFGVAETKVTIIPFGINNTIPKSKLTKAEARAKLGLDENGKVLLFFGLIAPYKGLEFLLQALRILSEKDETFRLVIAGQIKDCQAYWEGLETIIQESKIEKWIIRKIQYIPDSDVEMYFKASDVLILPYRFIFQSGVLFLSYSFGLPVVGTDVGSMREDILEGRTGMICQPNDADGLASTIVKYFDSDIFKHSDERSKWIISHANARYSWEIVGNITAHTYEQVLCSS